MRNTITQKRSTLYREWLLAKLANDERYYLCTLTSGIPDGDTQEIVLSDLTDGFYDEWLDEMIELYLSAKKRFAKYGFVVDVNGRFQVIDDENTALEAAGYKIPEKIYLNRKVV